MKHTKEPWTWEEHELSTGYSAVVYDENGVAIDTHISAEKAKHIVECVNACAGLNPAAIPDVVDAAIRIADDVQDLIDGSKDCGDPNCDCPMQDAYNPDSTLERLNDLLRALAKLQVQS